MNEKISTTKIAIFQNKEIRKTIYQNEWWFSVADIIEALTDTVDIRDYIKKMRKRDVELDVYWGTNCPLLEMTAKDGKKRKITCANTEGIFRIIQSIPSPKAEPFKRWLAKVGYERVKEIEDPELATKRTRVLYKAKGYPDEWIEKRIRGIEVREILTDEWKNRGVKEGLEYAILTSEISKATFGMTPGEYQKFKGLKRENLRDHMNSLELIFTMLGEASTKELQKIKMLRASMKINLPLKKAGALLEMREKISRRKVARKSRLEKIICQDWRIEKN